MCAVFPMSILKTMYAVHSPVTRRVRRIRTRRLDKRFDMGVEAYALCCALSSIESLVPARSYGDDGAGPVGVAAQRAKTVSGAPLDVCAPGSRCGNERLLGNLLTQGSRESEVVQGDAERGLAELRVVSTSEPRGELADPRPVLRDANLGVRRPFADSDRVGRSPGRFDGCADLVRLQRAAPDMGKCDAERRGVRK